MPNRSHVRHLPLRDLPLWKHQGLTLASFDLEITARCNLNCRHCYINRPAGDREAQDEELSEYEINAIADEAVRLGAVGCLITGGEPLLRRDFFEIYLGLKRKGLLVSIFTNGTLISQKHLEFFKKYPPRCLEVTVYGISKETYETITRTPGSFSAFCRGLDCLRASGIPVRLKSMALRSNIHEHAEISQFCRKNTKDYFKFDPFLTLRFDRDPQRNKTIDQERLSPQEIVTLELSDDQRYSCLENNMINLITPGRSSTNCHHIFSCGAGIQKCIVGYDGRLRLCESLMVPECLYDLKRGSLEDACKNFVPEVRAMSSDRPEFLKKCRICPVINLCMWCPAHAYLETGSMDLPVDYFCNIAHARAKALKTAHVS